MMAEFNFKRRIVVFNTFLREINKLSEDELPQLSSKNIALALEEGVFLNATYKLKDLYKVDRDLVVKEKFYWPKQDFVKFYSEGFRKVLANYFYLPCSSKLRGRVLNGEVELHKIGTMTHVKINPELHEERYDEALRMYEKDCYSEWETEEERKIMEENRGLIPCRYCRSDNTVYTQRQIRSADEPMTTFVQCKNKTCRKRFKFC